MRFVIRGTAIPVKLELHGPFASMTHCVIVRQNKKEMAMIKSFSDKETEKVFDGVISRKLPGDMQNTARRKLKYLNNAQSLEDLRQPPGNHFEALSGRNGYYSIRINDQWRVTFSWNDGAENVRIEDYH